MKGPVGCAAALALALVGTGLFAAAPAAAQSKHSLRDALFGDRATAEARKPPAPPVARYVSEGGGAFVLDRGAAIPLLKFENSAEVWVLSPHAGPRGDVIYKNELGEPVLRATKLGGMTLFTPDRPAGAAAALMGKATTIQSPPFITPNALFQRMLQAADRASRAARHRVAFETVQDVRPETSVLVADCANVAAEAFERMARNGDRNLLTRIGRVLLAEGRKPGATIKDDALIITYASGKGPAGRPSSERIIKVVDQ
ncbi:DUF4908 domain-containing protein [Caulobacter hibisci]|uniref:DUF4908 domain-containing protein n=1 Tax=Caulobacter hibisci TaxID=2035993 RepID=A0ABS0SZE8_9CAUL|nr:DUF4908 domain-containing protein [Caulobacter hibisci]MBI1684824.1 DUF4908 domain-containing protein [Caulobacter hibisci]